MKGGRHEKKQRGRRRGMCQRNNVQQPRSQQKIRNMFETLMFLEKQLEGQSVIQDADTVLADNLEDVDF